MLFYIYKYINLWKINLSINPVKNISFLLSGTSHGYIDFPIPFRDHASAKDCIHVYCNMAFRMSKTAIYSCTHTHTFFVFLLLRYTLPNSSFLSSIIGYLKFYFFFSLWQFYCNFIKAATTVTWGTYENQPGLSKSVRVKSLVKLPTISFSLSKEVILS